MVSSCYSTSFIPNQILDHINNLVSKTPHTLATFARGNFVTKLITSSSPLQFRIMTTPIFPVEFADFFIADQLNSLATVLLDISFVACYYTTSWGEGTCVDTNETQTIETETD